MMSAVFMPMMMHKIYGELDEFKDLITDMHDEMTGLAQGNSHYAKRAGAD